MHDDRTSTGTRVASTSAVSNAHRRQHAYARRRRLRIVIALVVLCVVLVGGGALLRSFAGALSVGTDGSEGSSSISASASDISDTADTGTDVSEAEVYEGDLELPVTGATGYAGTTTPVYEQAAEDSDAIVVNLDPGTAFTILEEQDGWWRVSAGESEGWVVAERCFINLPDVIPSIVYNDTNAYSSIFTVNGTSIPGITGEVLYDALRDNDRFGEQTYDMAVLYPMAKKICAVQQAALADGYTLVIYEAYRPYDVQVEVAQAVESLISTDADAAAAVTSSPWSISWFIATGLSNHQQGYAIDTTLAKVNATEDRVSGSYRYTKVTDYEELQMPTAMHALGYQAAALSQPVKMLSKTAWQEVDTAATMNDVALLLQGYCVDAGLTPLASEWWHFNDIDSAALVDDTTYTGQFVLAANVSCEP